MKVLLFLVCCLGLFARTYEIRRNKRLFANCPTYNFMCQCPKYTNGCYTCPAKCSLGSGAQFGGGFQPGVNPGMGGLQGGQTTARHSSTDKTPAKGTTQTSTNGAQPTPSVDSAIQSNSCPPSPLTDPNIPWSKCRVDKDGCLVCGDLLTAMSTPTATPTTPILTLQPMGTQRNKIIDTTHSTSLPFMHEQTSVANATQVTSSIMTSSTGRSTSKATSSVKTPSESSTLQMTSSLLPRQRQETLETTTKFTKDDDSSRKQDTGSGKVAIETDETTKPRSTVSQSVDTPKSVTLATIINTTRAEVTTALSATVYSSSTSPSYTPTTNSFNGSKSNSSITGSSKLHCLPVDSTISLKQCHINRGGCLECGIQSLKSATWSEWFYGKCSRSCGNGTVNRLRHCSTGCDSDCTGAHFETVPCKDKDCPVDGGWAAWSQWGSCSVSCGQGSHTRSRDCEEPTPLFGGMECQGLATEKIACNLKPCPHWLAFSAITGCSVTCGTGFIQYKRNCSTENQSDCPGSAYIEKPCHFPDCV